MKPVSELLTRLMPRVVGCPEPLALQALVDSAVEFCEKTLVIRPALDRVTVRSGVGGYTLDAPSQQRVARVISVALDGRRLQAVPPRNRGETGQVGVPASYSTRFDGAELLLDLYPTPADAGYLTVEVATSPTMTATALDDELVLRWYEAILYGAWHRLMSMPAQPFTNLELAGAYAIQARSEAGKAAATANNGRVQTGRNVTMRPFA